MSARKSQPIPTIEWVVGALGLVLTLALLGYLLRSALDGPRRPPDISVAVDSVVHQRSGWLAFVTATNAGDATAADVNLEGAIGGGSPPSSVVLDYLPPHSSRTAVLVFHDDPTGRVTVRATGFR